MAKRSGSGGDAITWHNVCARAMSTQIIRAALDSLELASQRLPTLEQLVHEAHEALDCNNSCLLPKQMIAILGPKRTGESLH